MIKKGKERKKGVGKIIWGNVLEARESEKRYALRKKGRKGRERGSAEENQEERMKGRQKK